MRSIEWCHFYKTLSDPNSDLKVAVLFNV